MRFKPHSYQKLAIDNCLDRMAKNLPGSALFLEPGLGKTAISLSIIEAAKLIGYCEKVLIIAPLRVAQSVWKQEIQKWGFDLSCVLVHTSDKNKRKELLNKNVDIVMVTSDGVCWLDNDFPNEFFDLIIVDESTKFKSWGAKRTKHLRSLVKRAFHRIILTGTPAPNSLSDLFPQHFLIDLGECLGTSITKFRAQFCQQAGFEGRAWEIRKDMVETLKDKIAPQCLYLAARDHLNMPELVYNTIPIELPDKAKKIYDDMEKELFAEIEVLDDTKPLAATTTGAKYNLCRQIANGGAYVYDEFFGERDTVYVHQAKVDALEDLYEELNGKQLLVAYLFDHDLLRIRERFPKIRAINGKTSAKELQNIIAKWKDGNEGILACQCQAMSHGIDGFQEAGSDICWFGLSDQPEVVAQLNARIYRQGVVGKQVRIHQLIASQTVDEAVMKRLESKDASQASLLNAIKEYRIGKNKTARV